jgi:methionyl-tRNA formyltransferase
MKVIFFGTPAFAAATLQYLLKYQVNIVAVVTKPDRPQGRSSHPIPTAVKQATLSEGKTIPLFQPAIISAPEFTPLLKSFDADLFVVVAFGEIIKEHLLNMPKIACINLHASLLPKYRGAAPIQRCIINGEEETGVTIMHMAKKMDAGDIISTIKVPIGLETSYGELEEKLCVAGCELLLKTIHDFERGTVLRTVQNHEAATYAPKIELEDCQIDWKLPAVSIHNLVRGVNPSPGAWCWVEVKGEKKRLGIIKTHVLSEATGNPGQILFATKEGIAISTGQQAIRVVELRLEGKKAMNANDFLRGIPSNALLFL